VTKSDGNKYPKTCIKWVERFLQSGTFQIHWDFLFQWCTEIRDTLIASTNAVVDQQKMRMIRIKWCRVAMSNNVVDAIFNWFQQFNLLQITTNAFIIRCKKSVKLPFFYNNSYRDISNIRAFAFSSIRFAVLDWLIDWLIDWLTALRHISTERL